MKKGSVLQLEIEPCDWQERIGFESGRSSARNTGSPKMNMTDWKRGATEVLLKLYKEHSILYNMKHPKYYNKGERQMALNTIIDVLEDHRPGTTTNDILKKIQTMRTQFGQEYGKVRRAQSRGQHYLPTIWWYTYLAFLRHHIRPRNAMEPAEIVVEEDSYEQVGDGEYEQYSEEYEVENDDSEIVYEIQSTPSGKDSKAEFLGETKLLRKHTNVSTTSSMNGAKEEIIFEITDANTVVQKRKHDAIAPQEMAGTPVKIIRKEVTSPQTASAAITPKKSDSAVPAIGVSDGGGQETTTETITVESDRARSLGNFVASQISGVKDDFLFYSTQMDVLNVINKALLKQLHMDKEEKAGKKAAD